MSPGGGLAPGQVATVEVAEAAAGQRLDNFLARVLKGVPRSHIYRLMRSGQVRVNGGRAKPSRRLQAGDRVRIPPVRTADLTGAPAAPPRDLLETLQGAILLEDADLLVIDKPAGLAVHGGTGLRYGLIEALRHARPDAPVLELVHRLDRPTSGCLLVAKNRQTLTELHHMLRQGGVVKRYVALLAGRWRGAERMIDQALRRASDSSRVDADRTGKQAQTLFRPLHRYPNATLVEARLLTGRTHQIRVHAASMGHPVAGDDKYGDFSFNRDMRRLGLKRLFLHAGDLEFVLPHSGRRYRLHAPLDPALQAVIDEMMRAGRAAPGAGGQGSG